MDQTYIEYNFTIKPQKPGVEILIAELAEAGFESFLETDTGVLAYISSKEDKTGFLSGIQILQSGEFETSFTTKSIAQKDWNAEWESQFQPIEVGHTCRIRTSFHPKKEVDYDIIINPKMAFGTGHHATTHLMLQFLLEEKIAAKDLLDMGCGTGVLSILAAMRKATSVTAIDIDRWSYDNTLENITLNHCKNITVHQGDAKLLEGQHFDLILANINRNILLKDIKTYASCLSKNGILLISGFYEKDILLIQNECNKYNLKYQTHKEKDTWVAVKMLKI